MQIITIVENNHITGVVYGTIEVPVTEEQAKKSYRKMQQKRTQIQSKAYNHTKHK